MKVIYKYELSLQESQKIEMPFNAKIIRVDTVGGKCYLWAIVDTDVALETRVFCLYKTGQEITAPLNELVYIGFCTFFIGEELCLYIFENTNPY